MPPNSNIKTTDPELGDVLATRVLKLTSGISREAEVTILVGSPRRSDLGPDYEVAYRLIGLGNGMVKRAYGIDTLDALSQAILHIGYDVHAFPEARNGRLYWLEPGDDLGLPDLPPELRGGGAG